MTIKKVQRLRCVGGPHNGEWAEIGWTDTAVILVKPRLADATNPSAAQTAAAHWPTLENMHRAMAESISKTTYVRRGRGSDEHLEACLSGCHTQTLRPTRC